MGTGFSVRSSCSQREHQHDLGRGPGTHNPKPIALATDLSRHSNKRKCALDTPYRYLWLKLLELTYAMTARVAV